MSLANAKEQLLQQYWITLLHYDWSDLCVMDRMDGFVQSPSFSLWFFTEWVCDKKKMKPTNPGNTSTTKPDLRPKSVTLT